jgi:transcriptional regulator with XRE-family HTH domain
MESWPDNSYMNINEIIGELEKAAKNHPDIMGNHTKLAELAKMHQPTVTRILNGEVDPQISNLIKIAETIGVKIVVASRKVIGFPGRSPAALDDSLLALYLQKMDEIFPEYGLNKLNWFQKTALAKIGYDSHLGELAPDEKTVKAEVIQWAQAFRASGGS